MDLLTLTLLAFGLILRTIVPVFLPKLTSLLDQFVLFSTPINSYRSLNEALFLFSNGMNPYTKQGQILHQPPLVLQLFKLMKTSPVSDNLEVNLLFAFVDTLIGLQLIKLNKSLNTGFKSYQIALFYMFNPLSIISTFAKSIYLINNLMIISVLNAIVNNKFTTSMALLAFATYLSYYPWYLLIALGYYTYSSTKSILQLGKALFAYFLSLGVLLLASYYLTGSWAFIDLCYGFIVKFEKITPNMGLWWYFFTEVFEYFSSFFIGVFNLYSFIFVIPLSIRFIKGYDPHSIVFTVWCIYAFSVFSRGYPCLADFSLVYSIIIVFKPIFNKLRFSVLVIYVALLVTLVLSPIFYFVWMAFNSGNANFFYAIGLSLNILQLIIIADFIWAEIRTEYGDVPDKIKLTQI